MYMTKGVNGIFIDPSGKTFKKDKNGKLIEYKPSNEEMVILRRNFLN